MYAHQQHSDRTNDHAGDFQCIHGDVFTILASKCNETVDTEADQSQHDERDNHQKYSIH